MSTSGKKICSKPASVPAQEQSSDPAKHGFVAMIPFSLKETIPDWQPGWPESLKDFPANILFASSRGLESVLYESDFNTLSEKEDSATLTYRTVTPSGFRVVVVVNKSSGTFQTQKYEDDELIRFSNGPNLKGAMMQTTMHGVDPNEPSNSKPPVGRDLEELRSCITDHWPPPSERRVREPLVFGVLRKRLGDDNLVFIPLRQARRLAAIHNAISEATTWKSFCDRMPLDDLWKVVSELREDRRLPAPRDDFDDRWLPWGYHDGDWPGFPERLMGNWLPRQICAEYGKSEGSMLNGPFLIMDLTRTEEIVRALEHAGFRCRRDTRLVRRACGYSVQPTVNKKPTATEQVKAGAQ